MRNRRQHVQLQHARTGGNMSGYILLDQATTWLAAKCSNRRQHVRLQHAWTGGNISSYNMLEQAATSGCNLFQLLIFMFSLKFCIYLYLYNRYIHRYIHTSFIRKHSLRPISIWRCLKFLKAVADSAWQFLTLSPTAVKIFNRYPRQRLTNFSAVAISAVGDIG